MKLFFLLFFLFFTSCSYRIVSPKNQTETVKVSVVSNDARLVSSSVYIQSFVAEKICLDLGWTCRPTGTATLSITIDKESIEATAHTDRGIPSRYNATLKGTALFDSKSTGVKSFSFEGVGSYSSLLQEQKSIEAASKAAADSIVSWLGTL